MLLREEAGRTGIVVNAVNQGCANIWAIEGRFSGSVCRMFLIRSRESGEVK